MTASPLRRLASLPLVLCLMAMGTFDSCGDDPSAGVQGSLALQSGNSQYGAPGATLSAPLLVRFRGTDTTNTDELADVAIEWEVTSGGGSLDSLISYTTEGGLAQAYWTLGSATGEQTVRATVRGSDPLLRVSFTAMAYGEPAAACTNSVVFQDDFEVARTWGDSVVTGDSTIASASVALETAGGNTGGYRRMVHHFGQASTGFTSLAVFHIFIEDGGYTPVEQGAINHLRYTEDRIKLGPTGPAEVGTGVLVRRNSVDHVALLTGGAFSTESWNRITVDLHGSDFTPPLDLSSGNFEFGYLRSNSSQQALDVTHGLDNWKMEVCR
jgi:hypothetical protein